MPSPGLTSRQRSKLSRQAWHAKHGYKIRYPSLRAARRARWRHIFRYFDFMDTYECTWANNWKAGPEGGHLHWHLGHRRRKPRTWVKVHVIWPYYRVRRWWRRATN